MRVTNTFATELYIYRVAVSTKVGLSRPPHTTRPPPHSLSFFTYKYTIWHWIRARGPRLSSGLLYNTKSPLVVYCKKGSQEQTGHNMIHGHARDAPDVGGVGWWGLGVWVRGYRIYLYLPKLKLIHKATVTFLLLEISVITLCRKRTK